MVLSSSITKVEVVSENKANFLLLPYKCSIVLTPKSTTVSRQMMSHTAVLLIPSSAALINKQNSCPPVAKVLLLITAICIHVVLMLQ